MDTIAHDELTDEERAEQFAAEQAALDAENAAAGQEPGASLREQIDAAHEANGSTPPPRVGSYDPDAGPELQDDRDDTERQAGGDRLPTAADDDPQPEMFPETLTGTGKLGFSVGGKQPTTSTLTLTGGKIDVEGGYAKGETITLRVQAVVRKVAFADKADQKTGQVTDSERQHSARITSLSVIDD